VGVDRTIKLLVAELLHRANGADCNLIVKRVENEGYVINDEEKTKVVAVGLLNIKNEDDEDEPVIGAFTINVKKYKWADAEGFTLDQMVEEEKLNGEIFNLIGVDEVFDYLCSK
jgi:hypothetical protein